MKKKIISLLTIFSMILTSISALTGCDSSKSTSASESTNEELENTSSKEKKEPTYTWLVDPTIEADDIIVFDESIVPNSSVSLCDFKSGSLSGNSLEHSKYAIIKRNNKYGYIGYDTEIYVEPSYPFFSGCSCGEVGLTNGKQSDEDYENINLTTDYKTLNGQVGHGWVTTYQIYDTDHNNLMEIPDNLIAIPNFKKKYLPYKPMWMSIVSDRSYYYEYTTGGVAQPVTIDDSDVEKANIVSLGEKYALHNNFKLTTDFIFDLAYSDKYGKSGIAACKKDGKWGYYSYDGKEIIPCQFDDVKNRISNDVSYNAYLPTCGYIAVNKDGGYGYYNTDGKEVIPCGEFEQARPVYDGKAWVKKDGKWGVISINEDNLSKIVDYTDMDKFVADTILCETEYNPSRKIAYPDDDRSWTYKQMTEVYMKMDSIISGAKNALGGSEFWFGVKKAIDGDFGELAVGWKMLMYTELLMDYLTYNGETEEFKSNFDAVTSKYISQLTSEILQPMDYDDVTEALKQMAPTEAVQFLKDNRYYEFLSDFNSILFDTIVDSAETAFDVIENTSRALALKDAEEGRVKFLNSIKEVSDDEDLKKAVDFVLEKYKMACNELTRDELALNEKTYTLCNSLTKKSWDLICSSIPGVGTVFKGIKLGEAGLNWMFNSEDNETNKMQLYIMYDFNEDAQNAFSKIRDNYINDSTTENAKMFNNSTCAYYNMQSYITTIADKYLAESLFNGAYNEFVNAFSDNNKLSYEQMNSLLSHDIDYCSKTCKQIARWYSSYKLVSEIGSEETNVNEFTTISEFKYEEQNGSIRITEFIGTSTEVYIPSRINNMEVSVIGAGAFAGNKEVNSVTIPDTVNKIESSAFRHCLNLTHMEIPDSVKEIEGEALEEVPYITNQTDEFVIVGDGVLIDFNGDFGDDVDLNIPDGVKYIGDISLDKEYEFNNIYLSDSVETIGSYAFCCDFNSINITDNIKNIRTCAFMDSNWINNQSDEFVIVGDSILIKYNGNDKDIIIPEGVKSVVCADEDYVFKNPNSIVFKDGIKYIGDQVIAVFATVNQNGSDYIDGNLISDNEKLTEVYIPSSIEYISDFVISKGRDHVTVISESETEVEKFCAKNNINFKATD